MFTYDKKLVYRYFCEIGFATYKFQTQEKVVFKIRRVAVMQVRIFQSGNINKLESELNDFRREPVY